MPAGYAEALMNYSPAWALSVVIIIGIAVAVVNYNITKKLFKFDQ
jgi:hypothetical protein